MPSKWTVANRKHAQSMKANGATFQQIAESMGITLMQAYHLIKSKPRGKEPSPIIALLASLGEGSVVPPTYVIAEAIARAQYPRTITQRHCGDPVLNQCALYRMQHGARL